MALVTAAAMALTAQPNGASAQAPAGGAPIIRDAEIENLLRDYTQPILRAAGLGKNNIQVVIINSRAFNTFVMDGRRIFVNAGALMESTVPNQIIGVLAHETGHISGGHLSKMRQEMARAQTLTILVTLLGIGAAVAGARSSAGNVGMATLGAPQEAIRRTLLSYIRQQEEQADRAAVKFLDMTGQSSKGMHDTFKRLSEQILYAAHGADPYVQSHPMPSERVAALADLARSSPNWGKIDPPALQLRHDMVRAKLYGYLDRPDSVMRRYPMSDASMPARYARAISSYRHGDPRSAVAQVDGLLQLQPGNAYLHELRGQILLESGKAAEAMPSLRKASQLSGGNPLINMLLGQALVAMNNPASADEAIALLRNALAREPEAPSGYTYLAMAYGRKGDLAQADLASAQAAFMRGDTKTARDIASRAKNRFPIGSPGWVKADDIVSAKPLPGQK